MTRPKKQHGFVLIATLMVLFIVALAASYFAERVTKSVDFAEQTSQNTKAMVNMASTRAEVLYRLATTSVTEFGRGRGSVAVFLDNRPYQGLGGTVVRIQDGRGLLNLNAVDDERLHRFLGLLGVPGDQRAHLVDTLRDYIDVDDLHRLNGAEKAEYQALNLPPPPNRNLVSPWETNGIIGWRNAPQLWKDDRLVKLTTTGSSLGLNPNTAPAEILATLPGVTDDIAQSIIASRKIQPIVNLRQFADLTGLPIQSIDDTIGTLPSNSLRIIHSAPSLAWSMLYTVTLTPAGKDVPWLINYYRRVAQWGNAMDDASASPLPARSLALPENQPL